MTASSSASPAGADQITCFAPASVSNLACGFDVLGFAVDGYGDRITATRAEPGVTIVSISGDDGVLPREAARNTAGVAAASVLRSIGERAGGSGVALAIDKQMPISSGVGSSAASAAAAAFATNALFDHPLSAAELLQACLDGEKVASGSRHADNVAPALLGGLLAVRTLDPAPDLLRLPVPEWLSCAVVLPRLEVSTAAARAALGQHVGLKAAVRQSANLAALIHGLHTDDAELIARSLVDSIAEPVRKGAVPGFDAAMQAARAAGALGGSLSGSGPALFALCREDPASVGSGALACARNVARAIAEELEQFGVQSRHFASVVGAEGARCVEPDFAAGGPANSDGVSS